MDKDKKFEVPRVLYWALGVAAVLAAIGVGSVYGFAVLLGVFVACGIISACWLPMLGALLAAGVLGALVSRHTAGGAGKGFLAGISYAAIAIFVGILLCSFFAVANFHG